MERLTSLTQPSFHVCSLPLISADSEQPAYLIPVLGSQPTHVSDAPIGPRCCWAVAMTTLSLPFLPWNVPRSAPLAAPKWCFQSATLFPPWLITILMECEGSWNVTPMTRARQHGLPGRSSWHIWKDGAKKEKNLIKMAVISNLIPR